MCKNLCIPFISVAIVAIVFELAGYKDMCMYEILYEFEFLPDLTTYCRVSCLECLKNVKVLSPCLFTFDSLLIESSSTLPVTSTYIKA